MLHWRSSALLRVLRPCSLALLRASVPVVPSGTGRWSPGGPPAGPVASLPPRGPQAHLRATPPVVDLVSKALADCVDFYPRRPSQFSRHRGSRRDLQRQRLHPQQLRKLRARLWPWLPLLAVRGGCSLRLWQLLCLLRGRLLLRIYIQAVWHQARSGLSWRMIKTNCPVAPRYCTGASVFWPNATFLSGSISDLTIQ